jgi:hypothetical protein
VAAGRGCAKQPQLDLLHRGDQVVKVEIQRD